MSKLERPRCPKCDVLLDHLRCGVCRRYWLFDNGTVYEVKATVRSLDFPENPGPVDLDRWADDGGRVTT